ncbi:MAG: hypothetical protein BWY74_01111 [Firmicutes bacterium ADurb.Bin419]|nr:MAG: hypothetical protein BWY74_01111 [Firmicutes bacterium ADurb.Bin419]
MKKVCEKLQSAGFDSENFRLSISTTIDTCDRNIHIYHIDFEHISYDEKDNENKISIGDAICTYINAYDCLTNKENDLFFLADSYELDLATAVSPVIDEDGCLKDEYSGSDVLYIERFYIKPEYRGKGIGHLLFPLMINVISKNAGVITIIPAPSEENGDKKIDVNDERYKPTLKRMTSFIEQFNFKKINSEVWVKDNSLV